jgi:hypothetical protein
VGVELTITYRKPNGVKALHPASSGQCLRYLTLGHYRLIRISEDVIPQALIRVVAWSVH